MCVFNTKTVIGYILVAMDLVTNVDGWLSA